MTGHLQQGINYLFILNAFFLQIFDQFAAHALVFERIYHCYQKYNQQKMPEQKSRALINTVASIG
jgi:hypothetical protein